MYTILMTSVFTARCYAKRSIAVESRLSVTLMTLSVCVGYIVLQ